MNIKKMNEILRYRDFLQSISQISFSFSALNRDRPIFDMEEEDSTELLSAYKELAIKVKNLTTENEKLYKEE